MAPRRNDRKLGWRGRFQLYLVSVETREQLEKIHELTRNDAYDFWDVPRLNRKARVMVNRRDEGKFEGFLEQHEFDFDIAAENVQQLLNNEKSKNEEHLKKVRRNAGPKSTIDFDHYWSLEEVYDFVEEVAAKSDMVTAFDIGTTHEGRPLKALTLSKNGYINMERPVVFMDAGIHAREWATIMTIMHLLHEFTEHPELYAEQLDNTDFVIIPVLNPDGYVFAHQENRLWRKNRAQYNMLCAGVDLNRNFPAMWRFTSNACTSSYAGPFATSEPETRAMMSLMDQYKAAMVMYVAVHTSGEMVLWPWGYEATYVDNWEEHDELGKQAAAAIVAVGGPEWTVGNSVEVLNYEASGATDDYAYTVGARLAYTIELKGAGTTGFEIAAEEISKCNRETMELYKVFFKYAGGLALPNKDQ
ncbi:carboxypeptidase B [Culex quinquefasciatus]|uniref:carboxypeptidase B n=1 Tax=Culex quinquefasciatus TaxID=7176 RepID=UPI0018E3657C|nr:carboxypeptidase B [Culex quinquefasciatus]